MKNPTPDWNDRDYEICRAYDEKVKNGTMHYRIIGVE